MRQFLNHVDHVAWVCHIENLERYAKQLSALANVEMMGPFVREDLGLSVYISYEGGLEIVAPLDGVHNEFNSPLRDRLAEKGEGIFVVILGVPSLDTAVKRARDLGYEPGPELAAVDAANGRLPPWMHQHSVMRESVVGDFMNSWFAFGEIHYVDGVIKTVEPKAAGTG
jgi:hypothetical protein